MTAHIVIEVVSFEGCPHREQALAQVAGLLRDHGVAAELTTRSVEDAELAERERFLGSPTVRVNGRDVEPGAEERRDYGLTCRMYRTPAGLSGLPSDAWILDAIAREATRGAQVGGSSSS